MCDIEAALDQFHAISKVSVHKGSTGCGIMCDGSHVLLFLAIIVTDYWSQSREIIQLVASVCPDRSNDSLCYESFDLPEEYAQIEMQRTCSAMLQCTARPLK